MWGSDVMMMVRDVGAFIRVLVPIRLSGGYTVTFGAWLGVHPDDLRHAYEVWNGPEYSGLELSGRLANRLPPLGGANLRPAAHRECEERGRGAICIFKHRREFPADLGGRMGS